MPGQSPSHVKPNQLKKQTGKTIHIYQRQVEGGQGRNALTQRWVGPGENPDGTPRAAANGGSLSVTAAQEAGKVE